VPDDPRPPLAIRITRPYATEAEFLEQELDTLTRTSITLLGTQARPQGDVLRFELVLSSGHVLARGEGRVAGFKPNAHQGMSGLTLRFTRLDSKSKAFVDKVASLRERRGQSAMPGAAGAPPAARESVPPSAAASVPPPPSARASNQPPPLPQRASKPAPPPPSEDPRPSTNSVDGATAAAAAPPTRDALLDRLRARATTLDAAAVRELLEQRRRV
jgi:nucleoid-associated protein YgaU